ncbi:MULTISPECIES: DUF4850 domain-containing protein [Brevibacillus]|jgi:hypothetical protein|uniref:Lipoprotein n=3 Tax=Brevibacillus borstelensis TaxID=45462 RepID=M8DAF0_9BACL|nr:DUF4850 domain-containing protein [Brevibacillus borstelensis]EMT50292.1 hypothetical protein I532_23481 [Brevibacillus borstelensis AK1]KKX52634.1 hypothetical protein X546_24330 [Brevibacillus borstelensis cifa_chp40]MBE5397356.1 DUF4850 domain-containing protein [Brevibacillus borstelensis]MCC0565056.1 DUF4850 domain-containing protein [Brevibacillus borstelensis]MCM3471797.1 DUF4850 domain-containing protein [Brevibacillus borstelensis]
MGKEKRSALRFKNLLMVGLSLAAVGCSTGPQAALHTEKPGEITAAAAAILNDSPVQKEDAAEKLPASFMIEAGQVSFQGKTGETITSLPLKVIKAEFYIDGDQPQTVGPKKPYPVIPLSIPQSSKDELGAYWMDVLGGGSVFFIGPRDWTLGQAGIGANGSIGIELVNPHDPNQKLNYSDNAGGCQGCAITSIGTYFPDKEKWAEEQGFPISAKVAFKERTLVSPTTVQYLLADSPDGYHISGVAHHLSQEGSQRFLKMEISCQAEQAKTAKDILDLFVTTGASAASLLE